MNHQWDKSLINWNRTLGDPNPTTVSNSTSPRVMDTDHYYVGIRSDNYYYKGYVSSYSFDYKTISACSSINNNDYGLGIPVEVEAGSTYKLSANVSDPNGTRSEGLVSIGCYDANWNYITNLGNIYSFPATKTIPSGVKYAVIVFRSGTKDVLWTYTDIEFVNV